MATLVRRLTDEDGDEYHLQSPLKKRHTVVASFMTTQEQGEEDVGCEKDEKLDTQQQQQQQQQQHNLVFDPFVFIASLINVDYSRFAAQRQTIGRLLPPHQQPPHMTKPCLVLDLDETLVHCSTACMPEADFVFPVPFENNIYSVFARTRPFLQQFLERCSKIFEIVVFTASQRAYADVVLDLIDPQKLIKHRLFRQHCVKVCGNYVKDLSLLGRDLSQTMIVDNSPQCFAFNLENGVPCTSWFDDSDDTELLELATWFEEILRVGVDIRQAVRQKFRLNERIDQIDCFYQL